MPKKGPILTINFERHAPSFSLADNFEIPDHGILSLAIDQEISLSGRCLFDDVSDGVSNVKKVDAVVLHKGTASAWMRCSR